MIKEVRENIKNNHNKNEIKKTSTFNQSMNYRRNLNKTREKLRSLQKNSLSLLNHIISSEDKELLILKQKLLENEELANDNNAINLIYFINQLNGAVPKSYFDIKDPNNEAAYVTKKIFTILKNYKIFFFFFSHYKIDDKTILKLVPLLGYLHFSKNDYICKEGDNSSKMYFILKGTISFTKKVNSLEFDTVQEVEQFKKGEGQYFGEWDLVFGRKTKLSALCLEKCHIIYIGKDAFQRHIQEKFTKIESETKENILNILTNYIFMPKVKLERFVNSQIKLLFFKRSEIIYNEGEENRYLYLINEGEANLLQNIYKGEEQSLINTSLDEIKIERIQKKAKKINYKDIIRKPLSKNNNSSSFKLDLILNKNIYQVVSSLGKGSFAGLEIVTGLTYFKYTLVSNANFTSVYRINLKYLEEHLKEFMLNLMPIFFELEDKIHTQIDKIKYIDSNINPNSCKKYKTYDKSKKYIGIDSEENDETFIKHIKKLENKLDLNEGGFIKRNKKNIILQKQRNILIDQLKANQLNDRKIDYFVKNFEKEQLSKLKYKKVRLIHSAKNHTIKIKNKNKNNSFLYSKINNNSNKKNRPMSCLTNKSKNTSIQFKEGKQNNYNISSSALKSTNSSTIIGKIKNFNLFYKEEMSELQESQKKKLKKLGNQKILLYKMPKYKLTFNKIKQSLSIDSKALIKKVFIKKNDYLNNDKLNEINTYNYKVQSSIFHNNKELYKYDYRTINLYKNKNGNNILKKNRDIKQFETIYNNLNLDDKKINEERKNLFEGANLKKYNFYDTGLFDMPLAIQLGVN